mmetsp:Transcript_13942/g.44717  ORF Transcript_13942/g.44717 Transcript_13942/m.44717 type:complete len:220 (-) Transcript_13942:591-1250(-)
MLLCLAPHQLRPLTHSCKGHALYHSRRSASAPPSGLRGAERRTPIWHERVERALLLVQPNLAPLATAALGEHQHQHGEGGSGRRDRDVALTTKVAHEASVVVHVVARQRGHLAVHLEPRRQLAHQSTVRALWLRPPHLRASVTGRASAPQRSLLRVQPMLLERPARSVHHEPRAPAHHHARPQRHAQVRGVVIVERQDEHVIHTRSGTLASNVGDHRVG